MIEKLETSGCLKVLGSQYIGRLAYISGKSPYVVPVTYFHDADEQCILSYSTKGFKIAAMRKNEDVALQVDDIRSMQKWHSVLVHGRFEELEGSTAKKYLRRFSEGVQNTIAKEKGKKPKFIQDFTSRLQKGTIPIVYRIHISAISGKFRDDEAN
ncbi:pyridoxamine 5'-phosphate oxidase family protein [Maribacter sp.]|nr:pyridoxamine 5'-phosphate oxidase family protein [Maribacter sp.]